MSCPSDDSLTMPKSSNGRSMGVFRTRSSTASVFSETTRGATSATLASSCTFLFFAITSGPGAVGAVVVPAPPAPPSLPPTGGDGDARAGASSSSSSAALASSRIRVAWTPMLRIASRMASSSATSKIFSSCHVWIILATSRFSTSDCTFRKEFTAMTCTRSVSSALYRPVLSMRRMSSTRWRAWMSSQGKHCFVTKSQRTCDNCLACFA
mmetsp:Transcript_35421/g.75425  ORF Transcript_35421/g.75425 Transcript_35421/m.75425 type:complete len:210 (+) Transcript_35421:459-1088(+)